MKNKTIINKIYLAFIFVVITLMCSSIVLASYNDKNEELLGKLLDLNNVSYENIEINNEEIRIVVESSIADEFDTQLVAWFGFIFANAGFLQGENQDYKYIVLQLNVNDIPTAYLSAKRVSVVDLIEDVIDDEVFWNEVSITKNKASSGEIEKASGLSDDLLGNNTNVSSFGFFKIILLILVLVGIVFIVIKYSKKKDKKKGGKSDKILDNIKYICGVISKYISKYVKSASKGIKKNSKIAGQEIKKQSIKTKDSVKNYYNTKGKYQIKKAIDTSKDIAKKSSQKISKISKEAHSKGKDFIKNHSNKK